MRRVAIPGVVALVAVVLAHPPRLTAAEPTGGVPASCDAQRGERVFSKCAICHSKDAAVASPAGPNLHGVVGRPSATQPQFTYSRALREFRQTWTAELLGRFLADPAGVVPGNTMAFSGLKSERDRAAVICLLEAAK